MLALTEGCGSPVETSAQSAEAPTEPAGETGVIYQNTFLQLFQQHLLGGNVNPSVMPNGVPPPLKREAFNNKR